MQGKPWRRNRSRDAWGQEGRMKRKATSYEKRMGSGRGCAVDGRCRPTVAPACRDEARVWLGEGSCPRTRATAATQLDPTWPQTQPAFRPHSPGQGLCAGCRAARVWLKARCSRLGKAGAKAVSTSVLGNSTLSHRQQEAAEPPTSGHLQSYSFS